MLPAPKKVILFCPVREKAEVFAHALDAHRKLAGVAERWYFDDNDDLYVNEKLIPFDCSDESVLPIFDLPERTPYQGHNWSDGAVSRVAAIKDAAIQAFLKTDADFLFLIDADVIPHPDLVWHLASLDLPVVSEVFWSQWNEGEPWMPQVWDRHHYEFDSPEQVLKLRAPGVFPVGGLGACTLISRRSLLLGLRFAPVAGVSYWGEDRHFCIRASALDIPLHADTHYPPFHVYRPGQFDEMARWREIGSAREYFREVWLTDQWKDAVRSLMTPRQKTIAVCLPGEHFGGTWLSYWTDLHAHLIGRGFKVGGFFCYTSNPHVTRQAILEQLLASENAIDYVLWLDDDQIVTGAQVDRMIRSLDALPELCAVAGWTWIDTVPPRISAGILTAEEAETVPIPALELFKADGIIEVGYTGFPAVLMRMDVLRAAGAFPFAPIPAPKSRWGFAGEDVAFCIKARANGARFFVDPKVFVPHLKGKAMGLSGLPCGIPQAIQEAQGWMEGQVQVSPVEAPVSM